MEKPIALVHRAAVQRQTGGVQVQYALLTRLQLERAAVIETRQQGIAVDLFLVRDHRRKLVHGAYQNQRTKVPPR